MLFRRVFGKSLRRCSQFISSCFSLFHPLFRPQKRDLLQINRRQPGNFKVCFAAGKIYISLSLYSSTAWSERSIAGVLARPKTKSPLKIVQANGPWISSNPSISSALAYVRLPDRSSMQQNLFGGFLVMNKIREEHPIDMEKWTSYMAINLTMTKLSSELFELVF